MDPSLWGAAGIEPLLRQAVGDAEAASAGAEALDRVLGQTERTINDLVARSHAEADIATAETLAEVDAAVERRRTELRVLRHRLMDQAWELATRFEDLLDRLEDAEANLPSPLTRAAAEPAPEVEEIRMIVRERGRLTFAHDVDVEPQEVLFARAPAGMTEPVGANPPKRRWWRRLRGEAA